MKRAIKRFLYSVSIALAGVTHAATEPPSKLSLSDVLSSTERTHPLLKAANAGLEAAEGGELRSLGLFDPVLRGKTKRKWETLYPNTTAEAGIFQRSPILGSEFGAFYRNGAGVFGPYELDNKTLGAGEWGLRINQPLLRGLVIDPPRFQVFAAEQEAKIAKERLNQARIEVYSDASRAYLRWLSMIEKEQIRKEVLELAIQRQEVLRKRVATGDSPKLQYEDNERLILDRRSRLIDMSQGRQAAALTLSLYYRERMGGVAEIPPTDTLEGMIRALLEWTAQANVEIKRPELRQQDLELDRLSQEERVARNTMLPELNIQAEASRDFGNGPIEYRDPEYSLGLTLSVPLLFREARGRTGELVGRQIQTEARRQWLADVFRRDLDVHLTRIAAAKQNKVLKTELLAVAKLVENAERKRFSTGAGDLIDVNIREESTAIAALELVDARLDLALAHIDYWATRGDYEFAELLATPR
jgi:outer membrane protein TolC